MQIKREFVAFGLVLFMSACNNKSVQEKSNAKADYKTDTSRYAGLQGTWINHNKDGFTLIEIKDKSHVLYYSFRDKKPGIDTIATNRYWYYSSNAVMDFYNRDQYNDEDYFWIKTRKYTFDYKTIGDTLIEIDKTGDQQKYIRVYEE